MNEKRCALAVTAVEAIFLGIVQGLTEFLPVSSSGHLVLFSKLLDVQQPSLVFEIVVHAGTLVAVVAVFWEEILLLARSFLKMLKKPQKSRELLRAEPGCRLLLNLIMATLPVVFLALAFKKQIEAVFLSSLFVGLMLLLTGTVLFISQRLPVKDKELAQLTVGQALTIGVAQAIAVLPGISRSGTTIAGGRAHGLSQEAAARFSFLLSIPAILGAVVFSLADLVQGAAALKAGPLVLGFLASAFTGYFAIRLLLNLLKRERLIWFSYYTWAVGLVVILLSLI